MISPVWANIYNFHVYSVLVLGLGDSVHIGALANFIITMDLYSYLRGKIYSKRITLCNQTLCFFYIINRGGMVHTY